jgi:diadenosine tetraphosphatase ApaH/serine/threonine PP2A family protein phosphatase
MVVALLADIHANREALDACLAHARRAGAERCAFLGDLVGYGPDPQAVIDTVRNEVAAGGIAVRGNHDAALAGDDSYMNRTARQAIAWTRTALDAGAKSFLAALPLTVREGAALMVHASALAPERWTYVDTAAEAQRSSSASAATWTFSGHVHEQCLYFEHAPGRMREFRPTPGSSIPVRGPRRWLAIAGAVGQSRDGNPAAAYALWDRERELLTFHRVAYDWHAAAEKARRARLPEPIAYRLERGI